VTRARDVATQGGLVLLNTTTFSAQSAVSIDNVFSSTYQNYKIETKFTQNTANSAHYMKLRVGGVDAAGNWRGGGTYNYATSNTLDSYRMNGGAEFAMGGGLSGSSFPAASFTIFSPYVVAPTIALATGFANNPTASYSWNLNAYHDISPDASYDGIKFLATSGTITGTVRIYGVRN
jgi:hypothetical protein